jgi:sporulation protein YlmC with PRC-barrel domain
MALEKRPSKELLGKLVVTKEGKKIGFVKDLSFEARSGELIHVVVASPTAYAASLSVEAKDGGLLVPYSAILAIGDFVVIGEEDIR